MYDIIVLISDRHTCHIALSMLNNITCDRKWPIAKNLIQVLVCVIFLIWSKRGLKKGLAKFYNPGLVLVAMPQHRYLNRSTSNSILGLPFSAISYNLQHNACGCSEHAQCNVTGIYLYILING